MRPLRFRPVRPFLLAAVFLLLGGSITLPQARGVVDEQVARSKVRVPKGVITDVALARNPDTGDLLVVYESDGRIYATVMKERRQGKFKGRKARRISPKKRIHRRPTAIWNPAAGNWIVAWDTAPARLDTAMKDHASGKQLLSPSEIHMRRLRAGNGKPRGSQLVIDGDDLKVSPQFAFVDETGGGRSATEHGLRLHHVTTMLPTNGDPAGLSSRLTVADPGPDGVIGTHDDGDTIIVALPLGGGQVLQLDHAPINAPPAVEDVPGGEILHPTTIFDGGGLGTVSLFGYMAGEVRTVDTTPADFPTVDTRSPGFLGNPAAPGAPGAIFWHELPAGCFYELLDADLERVGPPTPGPGLPCVPGVADPQALPFPGDSPSGRGVVWEDLPPRSPIVSEPGAVQGATKRARLFRLTEKGTLELGTRIATSSKGPLDTFVLMVPNRERVIVLWAEVRNRRKSKLWLEVIDLD